MGSFANNFYKQFYGARCGVVYKAGFKTFIKAVADIGFNPWRVHISYADAADFFADSEAQLNIAVGQFVFEDYFYCFEACRNAYFIVAAERGCAVGIQYAVFAYNFGAGGRSNGIHMCFKHQAGNFVIQIRRNKRPYVAGGGACFFACVVNFGFNAKFSQFFYN